MSDYLHILTTFIIEGITAWASVGLIACGIYLALDMIARGLVAIAVRAEGNAIKRDARRHLQLVPDQRPGSVGRPGPATDVETYQHAG